LIKAGAKLVEQPADVLTELNDRVLQALHAAGAHPMPGRNAAQPSSESISAFTTANESRIPDGRCRAILSALNREDLGFESLQARCRLPTDALSASLLQLEIQGLVCRREGRLALTSRKQHASGVKLDPD
jgi:predicted Rossmann fold nucleotide-binding protein DprA/Smf involved in DNA uptake